MDQVKTYQLAENALARGYRLHLYDEIGSTNDEALAFARAGEQDKAWFVAKAQRKGRGRQQREWISPAGNLHASLLLLGEVAPAIAPQLGFVAGVALRKALLKSLPDGTRLKLKWPNDILCDGAKLAGILLESTMTDGRFACVIGIGVNCTSAPEGLAYRATSLAASEAEIQDAREVFQALSHEIVVALDRFAGGAGFSAIREEWLAAAGGIDGPIRVVTPNATREGIFRGIDAAGRLILESGEGTTAIEAGDIWLLENAMTGNGKHGADARS
ncbi:MAG TPA: biotin--[acetyl-CoA-carboxylase] ligase [Methylovirgula sp.]